MYLFETYIHSEIEVAIDQDKLTEELAYAGFQRNDIDKALQWMERLATLQNSDAVPYLFATAPQTMRCYNEEELQKLTTDCRGFLLFLEQLHILNSQTREMVIDRVMALEDSLLSLDDLKWVVLMVLLNVPGNQSAYQQLETLLCDTQDRRVH
jgi:Smg protein